MKFLLKAWRKIPAAFRLAVLGLIVLALVLAIFFYGARLKNHIGNWWYERGTAQQNAEIDKLKQEIEQQRQQAADAVKAFEAEKLVTAEERKKREIAETILADKTKTTNQKLKDYQDIVNSAPIHTGPESTEALCARARRFGIECR